MKLLAAYFSDSVGVLSEGIHSFLDLVSASISFFTVREAGKPADHGHPFGHGKIETVSSLFESLLLILAAALIIYEGVEHFKNPHPIQNEWMAVGVMILSLLVSFLVYRHNAGAAQETESSALHVNALHFLSDVVASFGVLIGLVILKLTGWTQIDSLIAFGVAAYILLVSIKQVKLAVLELTDTQLPADEIKTIHSLLDLFKHEVIEAHDLRTRKSGATRHIDFHLVVCKELTVKSSHAVCDDIEAKIMNTFPSASVNIHVEPCEHDFPECKANCPVEKPRKKK